MINISRFYSAAFLSVLLMSFGTYAQSKFFPESGDTLNYSSVLFEFPWIEGASSYEIQISSDEGNMNNYVVSEANKVIYPGLEFGKSYSWKCRGITSTKEKLEWSQSRNFVVGYSSFVDNTKYRYTGKKTSRELATTGLLLYDYGRVAVNRAGKIEWYLPDMDSIKWNTLVRDLKMTTTGTFTALLGETAVEIDRNGEILWQAPDDGKVNGESREHYHHELTKLDNGNYLVLGLDYAKRIVPETLEPIEVEFGTVIEYDKEGNVVWFWNSKDYFTDKDLFSRKRGTAFNVQTHMNACKTDGKYVYVGFRDISRIVVIDKKSKQVIESYGGSDVVEELHSANGFFRRQHDALPLSDGNLAVFNNDSIMDPEVVSSVVIFSRISQDNPHSVKILDFKMDFDSLTNGKSAKTGNLNEMENGNILVCLGSINRSIELTRSGEVVWSMFIEQFDERLGKWKEFPQYRVSHAYSLYPFAFTAKIHKNELRKRKRHITVRVYNIGSEKDDFSVTCHKNRRIIAAKNISAAAENYVDITFDVKGKSELKIEVESLNLSEVQTVTASGFE